MYPAYQCLKTIERTIYCSSVKFKNHDEGSAWVGRVMSNHDLSANNIIGKPYTSNVIPRGAIIVD